MKISTRLSEDKKHFLVEVTGFDSKLKNSYIDRSVKKHISKWKFNQTKVKLIKIDHHLDSEINKKTYYYF